MDIEKLLFAKQDLSSLSKRNLITLLQFYLPDINIDRSDLLWLLTLLIHSKQILQKDITSKRGTMETGEPSLHAILRESFRLLQEKVEICNVSTRLRSIQILPAEAGSSDTLNLFVQYLDNEGTSENVFIKAWFGSGPFHWELGLEAKIVSTVVEEILKEGISPNFAPFLAYAVCPGYMKALRKKSVELYHRALEVLKAKYERRNIRFPSEEKLLLEDFHVLATKRITPSVSLRSFSQIKTFGSWIALQIIYAAMVLRDRGVIHGDLHIENILIWTPPRTDEKLLFCAGENSSLWFSGISQFVAVLIDWDKAKTKEISERFGGSFQVDADINTPTIMSTVKYAFGHGTGWSKRMQIIVNSRNNHPPTFEEMLLDSAFDSIRVSPFQNWKIDEKNIYARNNKVRALVLREISRSSV